MSGMFPLHYLNGFPPVEQESAVVFAVERYGPGIIIVVFDKNSTKEHPVYITVGNSAALKMVLASLEAEDRPATFVPGIVWGDVIANMESGQTPPGYDRIET